MGKGSTFPHFFLFRIVLAGFDIGNDIFHRHFRLQQVGGADKQTALFPGNVQILKYRPPHILRCAEGHDGLGTDGTVEGKLIAVGFVDLPEIHALRLYPVRRAMEI